MKSDAALKKKFNAKLDAGVAEILKTGPATTWCNLRTEEFDEVCDALAEMAPKSLMLNLEVSEYALINLDKIFDHQRENELQYLVDAFRSLHLEACFNLMLDSTLLAKRLSDLRDATEWGFFDGPPNGYAQALGKAGLENYYLMCRENL